MGDAKPQPVGNTLSKWREALVWAILVALLFQFVESFLARRTLWQRLDQVERDLQGIHSALPAPAAGK